MTKMGAIFLLLVAGTAHSAERLTTVQVSGLFVPGSKLWGKRKDLQSALISKTTYRAHAASQWSFLAQRPVVRK